MKNWAELPDVTVLVVDDDEDFLELITVQLEQYDITTLTTTSAKSALELLKTSPVDAIIADIIMKPMDGIEFLQLCGKIKPSVGQIIITGYLEDEDYALKSPNVIARYDKQDYGKNIFNLVVSIYTAADANRRGISTIAVAQEGIHSRIEKVSDDIEELRKKLLENGLFSKMHEVSQGVQTVGRGISELNQNLISLSREIYNHFGILEKQNERWKLILWLAATIPATVTAAITFVLKLLKVF